MHKGYMRRCRPPHPKEGKTGDHQYPRVNPLPQRKTAVASPKAREIVVIRRSGPEHAEVPPMKERPAMGVRKPLNNHLEQVEEEREDFSRRGVKRTGDQQRTPGRQNSTTAPLADEQRTTGSSGRHAPSRPPAGEPGTEATRRRRRKTKPSKQHQSG